jgi:predicted acetyltransferase
MDLTVRQIVESETAAFRNAIARGFGSDAREEGHDRFYATLPLHRTLGAFDGDEIVGTLGEFDFQLTLPGGSTLPMAGTTVVTVRPTHRRRGVLTRMMRSHIDTAHERGDPLAGLWSSEAAIYGRFGFGCAADGHDLELDTRRTRLGPPPEDVTVALVDGEAASKVIPPLYEAVRSSRAGMLSRSEAWWEHRRFYDPEHHRGGASERRYTIASRNGDPVGYAMFRQKEKWDNFLPDGEIDVIEVMAVDDGARRALWHLLTSIDLFPKVTWWNAPVDDPMIWEATNRRIMKRTVWDSIWVCLLDVAAALEGRRYERDGRLVMAVAHPFCPWAERTYELVVDGGGGSCRRVAADPDIHLDAGELGALYLGGRSAIELARAGLIIGSPDAVLRADRMFRTAVAPWCPEVF